MRFKAQILALGFLTTCGLPFWGQNGQSSGTSSSDSYREQLKASSAGTDDSNSGAGANSREAYKERLRRLAQGDESQTTPSDAQSVPAVDSSSVAHPQEIDQKTAARSAISNAGPAPDHSSADHAAIESVSLNGIAKDESTKPVSASAQVPASNCQDAYCEKLRQVADGRIPELRSSLSEDGRTLTTERNFVKNLAFDQIHIWESPFKLRDSDATWAVPFGIVTGSLVATDHDVSKQLAKPSRQDISKQISNLGLYSFVGAGAGFYGLGVITHDDHKRETGLLSGEAFINATLVAEALKYAFGRQRPFEGDHFGHIGKGGSSFPSGHAIDSWAVATIFAHEYPNPFVQIAAYGLASAVSVTRITADQHFPSDVLVGGAFGYLIGRKIYKDHHDPELGGSEYGTFVRDRSRDAEHSGSADVPLDSWVYPMIDRLAAEGIIKSNFDSERPFTRLECARLAQEAVDAANYDDLPTDTRGMINSLQQEFSRESEVWTGNSENRSAELESIYTRATEIAGPVLRDGYNFGQTIYNDFGRPYARGFNDVTGFSARATSGPLVFYFRGEYQHAPANPNYTTAQKALITSFDGPLNGAAVGTPQLDNQFPAADQFRVLDAYMGVNFGGNQLTLGQQSLWWGPGSAPMILGDNAEPLKMARLTNTSPVEIPLLSQLIGPMRYDMFLGQADGYHFMFVQGQVLGPNVKQPFVQGQRFTFKPTANFEFGFTRTSFFGGTGYPLTSSSFVRDVFSTHDPLPGDPKKPGYEQSDFDITYKLPGLRDWLTFYWDEYSKDEISPLFFPRRSAQRPGIYLAKFPKLRKLDLRVEGVYTDPPGFGAHEGPGFFYSDLTYRTGYRNDGNLLGNWIGREGRGVYAKSTFWLAARNTIEMGYREGVVDREFLLGGRYQDFSIGANFKLRPDLYVSGSVQYEHWKFPVLAPLPQNNFVSSLQFVYSPKLAIGSRNDQ